MKLIINAQRHILGDPKFENYGKGIAPKANNKPTIKQLTKWLASKTEDLKMTTTYKRNERTPEGRGIPDMPRMRWKDIKENPIGTVKDHLVTQYGETEATNKLRKMSGIQVLELAEKLKDNSQDETGIIKGKDGREFYSMPKMNWGGKRS